MATGPIISAITPCYRMGKYLQTFLERLPRQTIFDRLEVVLDHNEPSAEELRWVRDFQARYPGRVKHIVREKVDPLGPSMNRCIQESTGEWLAIWNVDDLRTPDSLEQQASVLEKRPDIGVVYGNFRVVSRFATTDGRLIEHARFSEEELTRGMILGPFFMFRKSLLERAGLFDEQLKQGADYDLAVRLALHAKAAMAPGLLGYYLNEGLGASTRPGSLQPLETVVIGLRYGIYDKLNYRWLAKACRYNIYALRVGDAWLPVERFVPDYEAFLEERQRRWLLKGIRRFYVRERLSRLGVVRG